MLPADDELNELALIIPVAVILIVSGRLRSQDLAERCNDLEVRSAFGYQQAGKEFAVGIVLPDINLGQYEGLLQQA